MYRVRPIRISDIGAKLNIEQDAQLSQREIALQGAL